MMGLENIIIKDVGRNQLIWYDRVQRMANERLPKQVMDWKPQYCKTRETTTKTWGIEIKKATSDTKLNEGEWHD